MDPELKAKIMTWWRDSFEATMFKGSMGELHDMFVNVKSCNMFLAQAIAYWCVNDVDFTRRCSELHDLMMRNVDRLKEHQDHPMFQYSMIVGALIEDSFELVRHLVKP